MMLEPCGVTRACEVGVATICTILCNYPMWIAAKRMGAGLAPFPSSLYSLYKGSGALCLSLGPTNVLEDRIYNISKSYGGKEKEIWSSFSCALISGSISSLFITSPIEYTITRAHSQNTSLLKSAISFFRSNTPSPMPAHSLSRTRLPPGTLAVCLRESCFVFFLFHVRPQMSIAIANASAPQTRKGFGTGSQARDHLSGLSLEVCSGVATAAMAAPLSHPAARIASYMQGYSVGWREVVSQLVAIAGVGGKSSSVVGSMTAITRWLFCGLLPRTLSMAGTFTVFPLTLQLLSQAPSSINEWLRRLEDTQNVVGAEQVTEWLELLDDNNII